MKLLLPLLSAVLVLVSGCTASEPAPQQPELQQPEPQHPKPRVVTLPPPAPTAEKAVDLPGLHNVVAFHDGLYSGAVPEGSEGFESLAAMGIRTIISVDGSAPEVEAAKKHGLRYVHLPITYGGIDDDRALEIARAVHDLPGPIYVHCHHGKHRSAAAVGTAAVALGYMTPDAAAARMKVSGTAPSYKGLYQCVADATAVGEERLKSASDEFPEISETSGLVDSMVEIDAIFDNLKVIDKASWTVPASHPDLVPAAEAGRLESVLRRLDDDPDVHAKSAEFREWLLGAANDAQALEEALVATPANAELAAASFKLLTAGCKQCHVKYRD